ncbi:MAG: SDR family NAD(P)-dependent oxidoreductase [Thermoleophilia bacterium]
MSERLKGKVAWISGGCSGMGLGTVEVFVEQGAQVVVADIQEEKGAALEERFPGQVRFVRCDVTKEKDIIEAIAFSEKTFGGLDVMYNNAGAAGKGLLIEEMTAEDWDYMNALLLRSTVLACREAVPLMKKRGKGSIINNSSGTAVLTYGNGTAYGTMKAGVLNFTRLLAEELAPHHIRVNVIIPGFILTSIIGNMLGEPVEVGDAMIPHLVEHYETMQPIPIAGEGRDIGEAVAFFASDAARWVTGVVMPVDGGLVVKNQVTHDENDPDGFGAAVMRARDLAKAELAASKG